MVDVQPVTITLREDDPELDAILRMTCILERFSYESRRRMLNYLFERFPEIVIAEVK